MQHEPIIRYVKKNVDEIAILAALTKIAFDFPTELSELDQAVLAALRRSSEEYRLAAIGEIREKVAAFDEDQIDGLTSNVKGILHEMEYVRLENEDGDGIYASLYPETNHPAYDVMIFKSDGSGEIGDIQLKATDDEYSVQAWLDEHPEGEIVVTDELAAEMGLPASGMTNEELTIKVGDFINELLRTGDPATLASYFPAIAPISAGLAIWELWKRYQIGEISLDRFRRLSALVSAGKITKVGTLVLLLSIPGINVLVGAGLAAKMILSSGELLESTLGGIRVGGPRPAI